MTGLGRGTLVCLLFGLMPCCSAQHDPVPIEPLLHHFDPRLVALGAWEVFDRQEDSFLPRLVEMVERWDPAQRHLADADRYDAMTVVLDVLIQRNQVVTPAAVTAIAYAFPDQALILASRMPFDDAEPILLSWYQAGMRPRRTQAPEDFRNQQMMARVAAMMLATTHPSDIAASIVTDAQEQLAVSVPSAGAPGIERCIVDCDAKTSCSQETAGESRTGWPPVYRYVVEEDAPWPADAAEPLVAAGGDGITFRRVPADARVDGCYFPAPLNAVTRHRLLAEMLHVNEERMAWTAQMNLTLAWADDSAFLRRLKDEIDWNETQLRATVSALFQKGLVTRSQMETSRPRLAVIVFDDRQPAQPAHTALPLVPMQDPRTTCRLSRWR